jgi:membrane associated rhomboid family serine protease
MASVFLHFNWWHLISNLIVLGVWGGCLEKVLGRVEMLAIFLLAGLWGSLMSDLYGPNVLAMGASGAVFAMVAAVLVLALLAGDWSQWEGDSRRWLTVSLVALALNALSAVGFAGFVQGVRLDHWAHGGGALCGLLLGLASALAGPQRRRPAFWATAVALSLAAGLFIASRGPSPFGG